MTAIRWDSIHDAIVREYARMNNGVNIDGWTSSAIADAVCYRLRDVGVNVLDVPVNCMEGDPRLLPKGHPAGYKGNEKPAETRADRDITTVIDRIMAVAPLSNSVCLLHLLPALRGLRESAGYTPPESMAVRWAELAHLLVRHLGQPDTDWKRQIAAIMQGQQPAT